MVFPGFLVDLSEAEGVLLGFFFGSIIRNTFAGLGYYKKVISMTDGVVLGHPYSSEIVKIWTALSRKVLQLSCTVF